ncbi:MAG: beta-lactamase family protein [Anaerolineae bacterium]|nr:beta-lactamase family protein [Anaerolineae bacterium]
MMEVQKSWLMWALAILLALGSVLPVMAQGEGEIALVPFEDAMFGLQGLVPEGWSQASPGVYARGAGMGDLTTLIQQAAPGITADELATALLPNLGLEALPEPSGTLETAAYTWTLYDISVDMSGLVIKVALALAEDDAGVTLVLLQALEDDFDSLVDAVYTPALEALAPLAAEQGDTSTFSDPDGLYSVPVPTNWAAEQREGYGYVYSPDELITASIVVVEETDPDAALAAAWEVIDPDFERETTDIIQIPDATLDNYMFYSYKVEDDEEFIYQAEVRVLGEQAFVLIYYADLDEAQQRQAQINIVDTGFKITAAEEVDLSGVEALPLDEALIAELEAYIVQMLADYGTPGAAVAIVRDGEVVYTGGFGVRNPAGDPVTPDTYMMIGSTTKTMTTLLMAQMVDAGLMDWDTPVTEILPTFRVADPDVTEAITVENLVCACTGVPRRDLEVLFNSNEWTAQSMIESLGDYEFFTDFGEAFQYSNQMVAAGGYIAALAGGAEYGASLYDDYVALMEEQIFAPVGMERTTFSFEEVLASDDYAVPYFINLSMETYPIDFSIEEVFLIPITPAGAAWSTINDMAQYLIMQMNGGVTADGTRIVSAENLAHTQQPQIAVTADADYGLGWIIMEYKGQPMLTHAGNTIGFTSEFAFLPEAGIGVAVLTNQRASVVNTAVLYRVLELVFDQPQEMDEQLAFAWNMSLDSTADMLDKVYEAVEPDVLDLVIGRYTNPALGEITLSVDDSGALILDSDDFQTVLWQYIDPEDDSGDISFVMADAPLAGLPLTFEPNGEGGYDALLGSGVTEYALERMD